jgi:hypothetical protein
MKFQLKHCSRGSSAFQKVPCVGSSNTDTAAQQQSEGLHRATRSEIQLLSQNTVKLPHKI